MGLDLAPLLQAAAEYGLTNSAAATRIANLARSVSDSAQEAWRVVAADPVLLVGLVVVAVLAALVMRNPAR